MSEEKKKKEKKTQETLETPTPLDEIIKILAEEFVKADGRLNTIETRLGRIEADLGTTNTLLDSIMKFLDQKVTTTAQVQPTSDVLQKIRDLFPRDLEEMLQFEESGEYVVVKPRQYLGKGNFGQIARIVREAGGEYVSAGKESHFRIQK